MQQTVDNYPQIRYTSLDGIRGIAAIIIALILHYNHFTPEILPFSRVLYWPYNFGWSMVNLFFILSGFIFYNKYRESVSNHTVSFKHFFVLRFSRLYPLHWLTFLLILLFHLFRKFNGLPGFYEIYGYNYSIFSFLLNIPMIQNGWITTNPSYNVPTWSVSIEVMMYLLFFAVFYSTKNKKKYILYCLLLIYLGIIIINSSKQDLPFFNEMVWFNGFFHWLHNWGNK